MLIKRRIEQTSGHLNVFYVPNVILASITVALICRPYYFRFVDVVTRESFKIGNIHVQVYISFRVADKNYVYHYMI